MLALVFAVDRLTEAAAIKVEEAHRQKSENRRRQAMDIPAANMRPRPELGSDEVNVRIVEYALSAAKTDKQCITALQAGKGLTPARCKSM